MNKGIVFFVLYCLVENCRAASSRELCNSPAASIGDCYVNVDVNLVYPPSFILYSPMFFPACTIANMTQLIQCYNNVIDTCGMYRDDGPDIMNKDTFQAFLIGTCVNKNMYDQGMECLGSNAIIMNSYSRKNCITSALEFNIWDAYSEMEGWTWARYCKLMFDGIECSINKTNEFGCTNEFSDFLWHSSYIRLPPECHEANSTKFIMVQLYREIPKSLDVTSQSVSGRIISSFVFLTLPLLKTIDFA